MKIGKSSFKYLVVGAVGGVVAGLFGAAGGMINALLLMWWLKEEEKTAMATSVFCAAIMSASGLLVYSFLTPINFMESMWLVVFAVLGGILGAVFLKNIKASLLKKIFALFIIYSAVRFIIS